MSITMIGLDTVKSVFQVHAVDGAGHVVTRRKLRRDELIAFFEKQAACTVVLEACGAAHHWARVLTGLGHDVKLIAPEAVRPFVKKGKKNDAADAAGICEAASRPGVRFVPIKSLEQQGVLALHSARALLVKQQTMLANAIRGLATEFGLTVPLGMGKLGELMALVDADEAVPAKARQALTALFDQCSALHESIETFEAEIVAHARHDDTARRLATIPGIGPITASLIAATVADIGVFKEQRRRSLDESDPGTPSYQAGDRGVGKQNGAHRMGIDDAQRGLPRQGTRRDRSGRCRVTFPKAVGGGRKPD